MHVLSTFEPALAVYERTPAGQHEILVCDVSLSPLERRLLSVVTGYTALADLLGLLGEAEVPMAALAHLLEAGLIRAIDPTWHVSELSAVWADPDAMQARRRA